MTDIVKRLRKGDPCGDCKRDRCACVIMEEAADEITRLTAENERLRGQVEFEKKCRNDAFDELKKQDAEIERLRAALERLSCKCLSNCDWEQHGDICPSWVARAALTQETSDE